MLRLFYAMVLCCLLVLSGESYAATAVGTVVTVGGDAQIERAGKRIAVTLNQAVFQSDTIITGAKGRVKLIMIDKSKVYIGSRTKISLSKYTVEEKGFIKASLDMAWGKARFFVNKLVSRKSSFEVHTSTAVLGVRGTGWLTEVINGETFVTQFEGVLSVQTTRGVFSVHDGQVASIDTAGIFSVRPATHQEMLRQQVDPDIGNNTMDAHHNKSNNAQGGDTHRQPANTPQQGGGGNHPPPVVTIPNRETTVLVPNAFIPAGNNPAGGSATIGVPQQRNSNGSGQPPPVVGPPPIVVQNGTQQAQTAVHIQPRFVLP